MPQVAGIRRFGAAALDLAWVAAGRYDGYWELGLHPWDITAGVLIVREAGGFATDPVRRRRRATGDVIAANPHLHAKLREVVAAGQAPVRNAAEHHAGLTGNAVNLTSRFNPSPIPFYPGRVDALPGVPWIGLRGAARRACRRAGHHRPSSLAGTSRPRAGPPRTVPSRRAPRSLPPPCHRPVAAAPADPARHGDSNGNARTRHAARPLTACRTTRPPRAPPPSRGPAVAADRTGPRGPGHPAGPARPDARPDGVTTSSAVRSRHTAATSPRWGANRPWSASPRASPPSIRRGRRLSPHWRTPRQPVQMRP